MPKTNVIAIIFSIVLNASASNLRLHTHDVSFVTPLPPNVTAELRRVKREVESLEVPKPVQQSQKVDKTVATQAEVQTCTFLAGLVSAKLSKQCCENTKVVTQRQLASYGVASHCEPNWQCEADGVTPTQKFESQSLSTFCGEPGCLPGTLTAMKKVEVTKMGAEQMSGICSTLASLGGSNASPKEVSNILSGGRIGKGGHRPQPQRACSEEDKKAGKCGGDDGACFPADAKVHIEGVGHTALGSIRRGDNVLVDSSGQIRYEPVLGFLHRIPGNAVTPAAYVTVVHEHGVFRASAAHLVFIMLGQSWISRLVGNLKIGDVISAVVESSGRWETIPSAVVRLQQSATELGMVAPFTSSGTLVVDGVVASNYASSSVQRHLPHSVAHAVFLPVRLYHQAGLASAWQIWHGSKVENGGEGEEEIHPYLRILWKGFKLDMLLPAP